MKTRSILKTALMVLVAGPAVFAQQPRREPPSQPRPEEAQPESQPQPEAEPQMTPEEQEQELIRLFNEVLNLMHSAQSNLADASSDRSQVDQDEIRRRVAELALGEEEAEETVADIQRMLQDQMNSQERPTATDSMQGASEDVRRIIEGINNSQRTASETIDEIMRVQDQTSQSIEQLIQVARSMQQPGGGGSGQEPQQDSQQQSEQDRLEEMRRQNREREGERNDTPPEGHDNHEPGDPNHRTDPEAWRANLPLREREAMEHARSGQQAIERYRNQTSEYFRRLSDRGAQEETSGD
ncbi:MAG: hypothetical protein NUW37_14900 [Planctomycetes bacterium]|nr:hypothetical protein [Planctomycetota bacterium]